MTLTKISTGHQVGFVKVERPDHLKKLNCSTEAGPLYAVCDLGNEETPLLYVQKVEFYSDTMWVVWYRNSGKIWSGYRKNRIEAVEDAIKDGWLYA